MKGRESFVVLFSAKVLLELNLKLTKLLAAYQKGELHSQGEAMRAQLVPVSLPRFELRLFNCTVLQDAVSSRGAWSVT